MYQTPSTCFTEPSAVMCLDYLGRYYPGIFTSKEGVGLENEDVIKGWKLSVNDVICSNAIN